MNCQMQIGTGPAAVKVLADRVAELVKLFPVEARSAEMGTEMFRGFCRALEVHDITVSHCTFIGEADAGVALGKVKSRKHRKAKK